MKGKKITSVLLGLCMAFIFSISPVMAIELPKTPESQLNPPSNKVYDRLWVGDFVVFESYWAYDEGSSEPNDTNSTVSYTVLNGEGVEVVKCLETGGGDAVSGLRFTKPGQSEVKVETTDRETGEVTEKIYAFTVTSRPADKPVKVSSEFPESIHLKIGDYAGTLDEYQILFENLNYGLDWDAKILYNSEYEIGFGKIFDNFMMLGGGRGGGSSTYVSEERTAEPVTLYCRPEFACHYVYKPGTITLQPSYRGEIVGNPFTITIEEPVIISNAPSSIKVGSTLNLTTELTNTSLENLKTADYDNPDNYGGGEEYKYWLDGADGTTNNSFIAYKPSVTVIEGQDLISQSNQDYSHTLTSSETLTFNKAGTVKLKISYNQYITDSFNQIGREWDSETGTWVPTGKTYTYNPEKIITIEVTEDNPVSQPVETINEETGIKLEAAPGVVPPDTVIQAEQVKEGGNFTIINNALKKTSDKWVAYDISLLSNGVEIQPNGNVKISIPRPRGLNMNKMVLYHVAEDGKLTQIPFTLDGTKDNILFETDHFSLYAVAESSAADTSADNPKTGDSTHVGIFLALGIASAGTMLVLVVNKKRRHLANQK